VKGDSAEFSQTRSGGLQPLGDDVVRLEKDGIHVVSSTVDTVDSNNMEFPAKLNPGTTWTSHDKIDKPGISMDVTTKLTVQGVKKITTKRGTFDALLVTGVGKGTMSGDPMRMDSESYYVKGIGLAKQVLTTTAKGKTMKITQQLSD
jgi:hypothetical protein